MTNRLLITSNLCLLVALIVALSRNADPPPVIEETQAPVAEKPEDEAKLPNENAASAIPPRRGKTSRSSRLVALDSLLRRVASSEYNALSRLHSELLGKDQNGYDTAIERQVIDYRLGELDGPRAIRWYFVSDPGRSEFARGRIFEGWVHSRPSEALAWWQALPAGNLRKSLLPGLVQGYLSAPGTSWETLYAALSAEELASSAMPLVDAAIASSDPAELIDLFEGEFGDLSTPKRNRVAIAINDRLCEHGEFESLLKWYTATGGKSGFWSLSSDRRKRIVRSIATTGGERAIDWAAPGNHRAQLGRVAHWWVRSDSHAAGKWLRTNPRAVGADEVAFQLAVASAAADPATAREWEEFISDEYLAETASGIISSYEK